MIMKMISPDKSIIDLEMSETDRAGTPPGTSVINPAHFEEILQCSRDYHRPWNAFVYLDDPAKPDKIIVEDGRGRTVKERDANIDDTISINLASDLSGRVFIGPGTFSVRQAYLKSNTIISGNGIGSTIFKLPDHVTAEQASENGLHGGAVVGTLLSETGIVNACIENISINGNLANQDVTGDWAGTYGFQGIFLEQSKQGTIRNCEIYNCWGAGIYVEPCFGYADYNNILDNVVHHNGSPDRDWGGIWTEATISTLVQGNKASSNYGANIKLSAGDRCVLNHAENSVHGSGILVNADESYVSACFTKGNQDGGIHLYGAKSCDVINNVCGDSIVLSRNISGDGSTHNRISGNKTKLINILYECDSNNINNNEIQNGPIVGISLSGASDNWIHHNEIVSCGQADDNTYDGIFLCGGSQYNKIEFNKIRMGVIRHRFGVYVSALYGDQIGNKILNNDLYLSGATENIRDRGTSTTLTGNTETR